MDNDLAGGSVISILFTVKRNYSNSKGLACLKLVTGLVFLSVSIICQASFAMLSFMRGFLIDYNMLCKEQFGFVKGKIEQTLWSN